MDNILDIRIIGIDEKRPPIIRKEPYIDLFFKLSCKPPLDWCEDFNVLAKDLVPPVKIDEFDCCGTDIRRLAIEHSDWVLHFTDKNT